MAVQFSPGDPARIPAPLVPDPAGGGTPAAVCPAHRGRLVTGIDAWLVTRYGEVSAALSDPRLVMSAPEIEADLVERGELPQRFGSLFQRKSKSLLSTDPPDHTRLRKLVASSFTARRVDGLRPRAEEICEQLTTAMSEQAAAGEVVDLVSSYAFPLPVLMICELLGVPVEDHETFRQWTNAIVFDQGDEASVAAYRAAVTGLDGYFGALIETKRTNPGEDLTSALVAVHDDGDRLDSTELRTMLSLLLVAGHETTVNLISSSILMLLRHPDQLDALRADAGLMPNAVEECLRHVGPVAFSAMRFSTADIELGEVTVPAGQVVSLGLWAADHDPDRFPAPDRFDITREDNAHMAFGRGTHFCIGANLARMEAQVALTVLLRHFTEFSLAVPEDDLKWRPANTRGPSSLPLRLSHAVHI
ncbi:cytochrome P450 [Kibdelosporangium banguiense]|uniref:Cytochrome P450 n=1 Tax=Kibdelosporangium banguiense TaxID=1365924 RepID=A0ABS4U1B8_9PSEU|nr:cytochrome P450 [Kibdelosporangium banguiense]MBP2330452.1 cytochrome P450 [Kibdelosporangium banguiense]